MSSVPRSRSRSLSASPWPALADLAGDGERTALPATLTASRAVWGKVHGAASDYRWIAFTPPFDPRPTPLSRQLACGREDAPASFPAWRTLTRGHFAVAGYPSRAIDGSGRSGFLEKQVLLWSRPEGVPAALGALLLGPAAAASTDAVWWERQGEVDWSDPDAILSLSEAEGRVEVPVGGEGLGAAIEGAIEAGRRALVRLTSEEVLGRFYADLVAGRRPAFLDGLAEPLPAEALAVLLLPLPRPLADGLSLAGWLPATRPTREEVGGDWDGVATSGPLASQGEPEARPDEEALARGRELARILLTLESPAGAGPSGVRPSGPGPSGRKEGGDDSDGFHLALWGPSSAGKTVLLAQLYDQAVQQPSGWKIWSTEKAQAFVDTMRRRIRMENIFPVATAIGATEPLRFTFEKEAADGAPRIRAHLDLEDRAGVRYEELDEEALQALTGADGVILLFDPQRDGAALDFEVRRTLDRLQVLRQGAVSGGGADPRPMAFCLSKADLLIKTPEDLARATAEPDAFVRERLLAERAPDLLPFLDLHCERYRFFPISAVGLRLSWGAVEPVVFYDESLTSRILPGGRSFNLLEPFTWVLGQLAGSS